MKLSLGRRMLLFFGILSVFSLSTFVVLATLQASWILDEEIRFQEELMMTSLEKLVDTSINSSIKGVLSGYLGPLKTLVDSRLARGEAVQAMGDSLGEFTASLVGNFRIIGKSGDSFSLLAGDPEINLPPPEVLEKALVMKTGSLRFTSPRGEFRIGAFKYHYALEALLWFEADPQDYYSQVDLGTLADQVNTLNLGPKGHTFIFAINGRNIAHPRYTFRQSVSRDYAGLFQHLEGKTEGIYHFTPELSPEARAQTIHFKTHEALGWVYGTEVYPEKVKEPLQVLLLLSTSLAGIMVLLTLLGTAVIAKGLTRPLLRNVAILQRIDTPSGTDLTLRLESDRGGEVGLMSRSVNALLQGMGTFLEEVRSVSGRGLTLSHQLEKVVEEAVEVTAHLESTASVLGGSFHKLESQIEDSAQSGHLVDNGLKDLSGRAAKQKQSLEGSRHKLNHISDKLGALSQETSRRLGLLTELEKLTSAGEQKTEETREWAAHITSNADQMEQLIALINHVASQTNLLSMNAAIEAAHAGDAGKGFSVVADEIRKLAEDSAQQARSIAALLKGTMEDTRKVHEAAEENGRAFSALGAMVGQLASGFRSLSQDLNSLSGEKDGLLESLSLVWEDAQGVTSGVDTLGGITGRLLTAVEATLELSQTAGKTLVEMATEAQRTSLILAPLLHLGRENEELLKELDGKLSRVKTS